VAPSLPDLPEPVRVILKALIRSFADAGMLDEHATTMLMAILQLEDA
jgi:hypothetical protein